MTNELFNYLPVNIAHLCKKIPPIVSKKILEIRLRINQPLQLITVDKEFFLGKDGKLQVNPENGYLVKKGDMKKAFLLLTKNSLYALERQLSEGYITLPGGHRVGFTGQAIIENNQLKTIKNINSLNYRFTKEIIGTGEKIIDKLYCSEQDYIYNTLIISPPLAGKTTLLRDLVRLISDGWQKMGLRGKKVGLIDERSEIAGAYQGVAQNKIGIRTDLLDNCPKARGMMLLIRSMSPEVVAVDEIGKTEDIYAIIEAINAGVSVLATVHGRDLNSIKKRTGMKVLIKERMFHRYIILSKRDGIGTVEKVLDYQGKEV